jgi:hypothetical protein
MKAFVIIPGEHFEYWCKNCRQLRLYTDHEKQFTECRGCGGSASDTVVGEPNILDRKKLEAQFPCPVSAHIDVDRITSANIDDAAAIVRAVLDREVEQITANDLRAPAQKNQEIMTIDLVRIVLAQALAAYPADRSCNTCDFFYAGRCSHFKSEPPTHFLAKGCDQHQSLGIPF